MYHGSASGLSATADWTAESDQAEAYFGRSVSGAGDVNNDTYDDVIIGAYRYDNGENNEGRVYAYYGSASGLSATADWTAESDQATSYYAFSVSGACDVNGDGYDDVIVGAYGFDNGESSEGRAFVYHGSASGLSATADWTAEPDQESAFFGRSVSSAGDVNNDSYDDVIVSADGYDNGENNEGRAFVYHGSASGLSATTDWTAEPDQADTGFGISVSYAGDVNNDGYDDVIVGANGYDNGQNMEGRAYAYYGSESGLSSAPDWIEEPNKADSEFGCSVSNAGDVNNDGYDDAIVGAYYFDNGQNDEGRAFVYHGSCSGGCEIGGICYDADATNPENICEICDPGQSTSEWSYNNGVACDDDGVGCTDDECSEGTCVHTPNNANCDDGVWCNGEETCDASDDCQDGDEPCPDDGEFCNGDESCDEENDRCTNTGDPCEEDEYCDEGADQCLPLDDDDDDNDDDDDSGGDRDDDDDDSGGTCG